MMKKRIKSFDYGLIIAVISLSVFGIIMIYSSSYTMATLRYEDGSFFFIRQLIWFGIGMFAFVVMAFFSLQKLGKISPFLVILSIGLLIAVLIPGIGEVRNNAQRWINISGIGFQPSEIVKIVMIVYFSYIYAKKQPYIDQFKKGVLPPLVILASIFLLILLQPDLGSATLIISVCGLIVMISGVRWHHLMLIGSIAISGITYFAISQPYRLQRLTSFRHTFDDPTGHGYQLINSYVSIATSGLTGNGLGNSVQKLGYLPEAHTDFIMAVVVEELGMFGMLFVIIGYLFILYRGVQISKQVDNMYLSLLALGITFQIIIQAVFNLGAVSGLLPITGIPLPFISYGGTSLVFTLISAGILVNISSKRTVTNKGISLG